MSGVLESVARGVFAFVAFVVFVAAVAIVSGYVRRISWDRATKVEPRARPTLRVLLGEARAFVRIARWSLWRRRDDPVGDSPDVVVLLHGMAADGACTTGWAKALTPLGVPILAPDHGMWLAPLEVHAERVAKFLENVGASPTAGRRVRLHFVGHSMGGIVVRAMLHANPALASVTASVTTVATPHAGTAGGRGLPWSRIARMTTGSPLFASLPSLAVLAPHALRTSIGATDDAVVYPLSTTHEADDAGATRHDVSGVAHAALLVDDGVARLIAQTIRRALAGAPSSS